VADPSWDLGADPPTRDVGSNANDSCNGRRRQVHPNGRVVYGSDVAREGGSRDRRGGGGEEEDAPAALLVPSPPARLCRPALALPMRIRIAAPRGDMEASPTRWGARLRRRGESTMMGISPRLGCNGQCRAARCRKRLSPSPPTFWPTPLPRRRRPSPSRAVMHKIHASSATEYAVWIPLDSPAEPPTRPAATAAAMFESASAAAAFRRHRHRPPP